MSSSIGASKIEKTDSIGLVTSKIKGVAHLIKYHSMEQLMTPDILFGIGQLLCDLAEAIDKIDQKEQNKT